MAKDGTTKGQRTRARILTEAIETMARRGFHGGTFQEIADACGLSQAAVLRHFPTKTALFRAAIEEVVRTNHAYVEAGRTPSATGLPALRNHFEMNIRWASERPTQAMNILLLYYLASFEPDFRDFYVSILTRARDRVSRHLGEAVGTAGRSPPRAEVARIGESLHEAFLGILLNLVATAEIRDPKAIRRGMTKIMELATRLVPGINCGPGSPEK